MTSPIEVVTETNNGTSDAAPGSALAQARALAAQQRQSQFKEIPVGGAFGDHLIIRYGVVPLDQVERYGELAGKVSNMSFNIDTMVTACRTLIWREDGNDTDLGVRLEPRLLTLLDWPLPPGVDRLEDVTAREVVEQLFGGNGMAVVTHFAQLFGWLQNPGGEARDLPDLSALSS